MVYYFALLRFVSKRKGHTETLINGSSLIAPRAEHEVVLLVAFSANCIYRRVLITQSLAIKLWVRISISWQIADSPSVLFLYLCILSLNLSAFCAASCMVTIDFLLSHNKTRKL